MAEEQENEETPPEEEEDKGEQIDEILQELGIEEEKEDTGEAAAPEEEPPEPASPESESERESTPEPDAPSEAPPQEESSGQPETQETGEPAQPDTGEQQDQPTSTDKEETTSDSSREQSTAEPESGTAGDSGTEETFETFSTESENGKEKIKDQLDLLKDVKMDVRVELGRSYKTLEDVLKLGDNSVVELDKLAGDPLDIYVNDRLVARGEVIILNDNFCIRVTDILKDGEPD